MQLVITENDDSNFEKWNTRRNQKVKEMEVIIDGLMADFSMHLLRHWFIEINADAVKRTKLTDILNAKKWIKSNQFPLHKIESNVFELWHSNQKRKSKSNWNLYLRSDIGARIKTIAFWLLFKFTQIHSHNTCNVIFYLYFIWRIVTHQCAKTTKWNFERLASCMENGEQLIAGNWKFKWKCFYFASLL